jgi:signal transduction histidine kinase
MLGFALLLLLTYLTLTAALREQIKVKVAEDLQALATEAANDGTHAAVQDIEERLKITGGQGAFYFLSDKNGTKLAGNLQQVKMVEGWQEGAFKGLAVPSAKLNDDEDHQLWGEGRFLPGGSFLFVGQDAFRVLSAQEAIIDTFLWSAGIALVLATLVGTLISQGFLRRIDAINRTSESIMEGKLKARIPVRGTSDEIDQLSVNLNRLFDSNQNLLESLKQVTINIAHDLRTPLSRLRQGLEEARASEADTQKYGTAIDAAISDSNEILGTFAALLRIAQIESGSRKSGFRQIDLSALVQRIADAYAPVAEDQGKILGAKIEPGMTFHGDAELLLQATSNLVENAIKHTPAEARIDISLHRSNSDVTLVVADTGPGIPIDMRTKVLERFFRLERSRTTPGNGLGLALVVAVADLHGISLTLEDNHPGLRVTLRFPNG